MRLVSTMAICASTALVSLEAQAQSVWIAEPLVRVQPASPPGASTRAVVKAARNEYEGIQLVVRAPDSGALSGVNVAVSDLVGPGTIAKSNIRLYRAQYIHVTTPSQWRDWASPNPPGDWADALIPSDVPGGTYESFPFSVPAGKNQPVYVEVYVPKGTPAGRYEGTITVTAAGKSMAVPLTMTVWEFTLPDKPALASDFWGYDLWMSIDSKYSTGSDRNALVSNLWTDLRQHRIGCGQTGKNGPFPDPTVDAILQKQAKIGASTGMTDAKLQELVKAYGAKQLYVQHHDEPQTFAAINEMNNPNGEVQRYRRNGVPELLTVTWSREGDYIGWTADVDIYVAYVTTLVPFTRAQEKLDAGRTVWSYTTGFSPNTMPSTTVDYEVIHERIVPWLDYATGLTGHLYWTPVNWCAGDPWTNTARTGASCDSGNHNLAGVLYYPGDKVGAPNAAIPAARLKSFRDGFEDYDYLALLASSGDPALASSLARTLAPAWNNWSHDPAALLAAREQAAARIVQLVSGGDAGVDGGEGDGRDPRGDAGDGGAAGSPGAADDDGAGGQPPFVACSCRMASAGRGRPALALAGFLLVLAVGRRRRRHGHGSGN